MEAHGWLRVSMTLSALAGLESIYCVALQNKDCWRNTIV
jgi:hypothetical protein